MANIEVIEVDSGCGKLFPKCDIQRRESSASGRGGDSSSILRRRHVKIPKEDGEIHWGRKDEGGGRAAATQTRRIGAAIGLNRDTHRDGRTEQRGRKGIGQSIIGFGCAHRVTETPAGLQRLNLARDPLRCFCLGGFFEVSA